MLCLLCRRQDRPTAGVAVCGGSVVRCDQQPTWPVRSGGRLHPRGQGARGQCFFVFAVCFDLALIFFCCTVLPQEAALGQARKARLSPQLSLCFCPLVLYVIPDVPPGWVPREKGSVSMGRERTVVCVVVVSRYLYDAICPPNRRPCPCQSSPFPN